MLHIKRLSNLSLAALLVIGPGCAKKFEVAKEITSTGIVSNMSNVALARSTAQNRALSAANKQLALNALTFEYRAASGMSTLAVTVPTGMVAGARFEFIPITKGMITLAKIQRDDAVLAEMSKLVYEKGQSSVRSTDLAAAFLIAESRALRDLVARSLKLPPEFEGTVKGTITVGALQPGYPESGLDMTIYGNVVEKERGAIGDEQKMGIYQATVNENRLIKAYPEAMKALELLLAKSPEDLDLIIQQADLSMDAADFKRAAASYGKALEQKIDDQQLLKSQIEALRAAKDEAAASAAEAKLKAVEEAAAKKKAEDEAAATLKADEDAKTKAAEEAAAKQKAAEDEAAKKKAEDEAAKKKGKKPGTR